MAPVWEVMQQMREQGLSSLIVDRKDIADQVVADNLPFDRVNIGEIIREPVLTLHPGTDICPAINIINPFKV